jgi:hypothetical protein
VLTAAFIRTTVAVMVEAVSISETSVNFCQTTWRNIPEGSHHHTRHCDDLKTRKTENFGRNAGCLIVKNTATRIYEKN